MELGNTKTSLFLGRWHAGDQKSLDALLERHLPWIRDQVRRRMTPLLRKRAETCDFVQDVVVQFLRFGPRFTLSHEAQFRALLLKIVESSLHNKYDWFTAKRRDMAREHPLPSDTILSLDPPQRSVKTPSVSAEGHEQEAWIRLGLEFLDMEDRELLVLRKWDNLSFEKIGERFKISANAARKRHNSAVRKLGSTICALRNNDLVSPEEEP